MTTFAGMFYDLKNAFAAVVGPAVPMLNKITQFLQLLKYTNSLFSADLNCKTATSAVLIGITVLTLLAMLTVSFVLAMTNPMLAFGVGLVLDVAFDALIDVTENCS